MIHQPDFLPYMGFFHRFLCAGLWVILDDVQLVTGSSRSWTSRDKIKTPYGEKWITVGVKKSPMSTNINEVYLADNGWKDNSLNLIIENYRKAPFFKEIFPFVEELYNHDCQKLIDFNIKSIDMIMKLFEIKIDSVLASSLKVEGKSNERLINILKKIKATTYLSGIGARDYMNPELFEEAGIKVIWQEFKHPVYPQLHGEFIPYLSSIDLLFNCGIEKSREIIRSC